MNRGLLIVLLILLIGNLGMYFYQDPITVLDDENTAQHNTLTKSSPPEKNSDLNNSITISQKDKGIQNKPINHATQIKKETNGRDYARSTQSYGAEGIIDIDDELMMEEMSRHNEGQTAQDTGEFIDPDEFMIESLSRSTEEPTIQDTGEFIDPDE